MESHWEKLRAPCAVGCTCTSPIARVSLRYSPQAGYQQWFGTGTISCLTVNSRETSTQLMAAGCLWQDACWGTCCGTACTLPCCRAFIRWWTGRAHFWGAKTGLAWRAGGRGGPAHLDEAPVAVAGVPRRDALADDARAGVLPNVKHLGARVSLCRPQPCHHTLQAAVCASSLQYVLHAACWYSRRQVLLR